MSPKWEACRGISMFIVLLLLFLNAWRLYSKNQIIRNDGTWDGNDVSNCIEFKHNPTANRLECNKRYGSKVDTIIWVCFVFFLFWLASLLIIIAKCCCSRVQDWRQESEVPGWGQERTGIPVRSVRRDFSFYNISFTNPSTTPAHIIALAPTRTVAETVEEYPPEYLPPPAYNQCVINMRDNDNHGL